MSMQKLAILGHLRPPLDDEGIKALAKVDEAAAIEHLIRRYREPLIHHAALILKDWSEAVDVAQEVFIRALREPLFFDEGFRMRAWLYRVTTNLCFNLVRDRRRRAQILEMVPRPVADEPKQAEILLQNEQQDRILAAMQRLSEDHRKVLMLRFYSDLSYAEIGDALDLKLGTVMSRLARAKDQLTRMLERQDLSPDPSDG